MDGPVGVQVCGWACSHVGMRMQMAVNKKKKLTNWFQACGWACGHVGVQTCGRVSMWMSVQKWMTVKKEKKKKKRKEKEKEKAHWCSEWADGRVDMLQMGMCKCACGQM